MDSEKVIKRDNEYVLHTYNRNPIALEKGHGLYAEGPEGQKYLDFTSGIGVNSLGYCDLTWAEAVSEQAHKLQHTSNLYYTAPCGMQQLRYHEQGFLRQLRCRGQRGCHQGCPQVQL